MTNVEVKRAFYVLRALDKSIHEAQNAAYHAMGRASELLAAVVENELSRLEKLDAARKTLRKTRRRRKA